MASFRPTRFPGPMFNQNFPLSNLNINPPGDGLSRPQFQRPPNAPFIPFQTPERPHGNFQNRPPFSNFPEPVSTTSFRQPPPNQPFRMNLPPSDQMFRLNTPPPYQMFRMSTAPPNQLFRVNTPPSDQVFRMNTPSDQGFRMNAQPSDQVYRMNTPSDPVFRMNTQSEQVFRMNTPPQGQIFPMNAPPSGQVFRMNTPPSDQVFRMNTPPSDQVFRMNTPPPGQMFPVNNTQPHDRGFRRNDPPPDRTFQINSPPVHRPRFSGPFQRQSRPWNRLPSFTGPRSTSQFQSPPRSRGPAHHDRELPLQSNKNRRQKTRESRKLKPEYNPEVPKAPGGDILKAQTDGQKKPRTQKEYEMMPDEMSWMTNELFAEVKKKNKLYLKAKSSDEQTAWQEFRLQRNRVSALVKEAKIKAGLISRKMKEEDNKEKPFACDTCDRAFVTENELKDHLSQHIECDHVNCTFKAHPKIVILHKRMQHDTGYADRINKLKDDAEIQKWREERRRRFPTSENVRKRQEEQAEREARGEVLETKEFGKFKRKREDNGNATNNDYSRKRMRGRGQHRHHNRRRNFQNHQFYQPIIVNADSESDSDSDSHILLKEFSGMSSLTNSALNQNEGFEIISNSHSTDAVNENPLICPDHSSEQNLPKAVSVHGSFQSDKSNARNDSNMKIDQTSVILNDEKIDECKTLKNISMNDSLTNENPTIEECTEHEETPMNDSILDINLVAEDPGINVSVYEIPEGEIESAKQKPEIVVLEESDDEGPIAVPIEKSVTDAEDEGPEVTPIMKSMEKSSADGNQDGKKTEKNSVFNASLQDSDSKGKKNKRSIEKVEKFSNGAKRQRAGLNGSNRQDPVYRVRKSTLLEKLLADDIRHERNVVLQCIRHIVNNNFFGINDRLK